MARSENRQLSITAKLIDLMTRPLGQMQGKFLAFGKAIIDRSKGILSSVFNLRNAVIGLATSFLSLSAIKSFGEQADALLKLSASTGDTVENLSELQASFELAGVGAEDFGTVLKALETQARKAQTDGTDKLQQAFAGLGISIRDLQTLGPSQLFEKMAAGLEKYRTAQEKSVALGRVLPKQFLDLLPVLGKGLKTFQDAIIDARESGATVTQKQAEVAERLNDSLTKIQIAIGGVSRALIEQFGPQAIAIFERLAKEITNNREGIVAFTKAIASGLQTAFTLTSDFFIGVVKLIEKLPNVNLVDNTRLQGEIALLKEQLDLVQRLKQLQAIEARNRNGDPLFQEPTDLFGDANSVSAGFGKGSVRRSIVEDLLPQEGEIRERLNALNQELEVSLREGLAGVLQRARKSLADELASVAASVGTNGNEGPEALGLPSAASWDGYAQSFGQAMEKAKESGERFKSVFTDGKLRESLDAFADEEQWQKLEDEMNQVWEAMEKGADKVRVAFGGNFWDGFNEGTKNAIAEITDFGRAGQAAANQILTGGFDGLSDAFADALTGTKKLKDALKDFARSFVQDLARIITRLIIVRSLSSVFSGGGGGGGVALENGGVVQGTMGTPMRAFAAGGVTNGPTLALFGEGRNREAFVPLPDNRTIPVTLTGGGGGDTHVHFNVSAIDARSVQQMLMEQGPTIAAVVAERAGSRTKFRQDMAKATR